MTTLERIIAIGEQGDQDLADYQEMVIVEALSLNPIMLPLFFSSSDWTWFTCLIQVVHWVSGSRLDLGYHKSGWYGSFCTSKTIHTFYHDEGKLKFGKYLLM